MRLPALAALPIINAIVVNANYSSKPLLMRAKIRVTQEAPDEHSSFVGSDVQPNQAVALMA